MDVLVVYATKGGATRGVAERIAARLRGHGLAAVTAELPSQVDPAAYAAVLVGSPVYAGGWLAPATEFVRQHAAALRGRPVWTFSVGCLSGQAGLLRRVRWPDAKSIADVDRSLGARGHRYLAGAIGPASMGGPQRLIFRAAGGRYGDFRDWPAIDGWADEVTTALTAPAPRPIAEPAS